MKRVVFIVSHWGSRSELLVHLLNRNDRVNIQTTGRTYNHPTDLEFLYQKGHKCRSSAAIYGDHLSQNIHFYCKQLHECCEFLYFIRSGKETMTEMSLGHPYNAEQVYTYYSFRLRRIYEMAKRTPRAALVTLQDLRNGKGFAFIEKSLRLKQKIDEPEKKFLESSPKYQAPIEFVEKAEDCFEYYLYKIRSLSHIISP